MKPEGWNIEYNCKPIPDRGHDWDYWHDNHDGENGLCGTAASESHALELIEETDWDLTGENDE